MSGRPVSPSATAEWRKRTEGRIKLARSPESKRQGQTSSKNYSSTDASIDGATREMTPVASQSEVTTSTPSLSAPESSDSTSNLKFGQALGEAVTLVQFSSAFCQPCRATRLLLADVAASTPGVAHIEIDAEAHLDLVREMGVTRTPTTFILNGKGDIVGKSVGLPKRIEVLNVVEAVTANA
jgi:thiol-disulfide isomerase/thioredoxin